MKEKIHPNYGKAVVRCVCGETWETGSTKKELRVDICSKCHPFFTGKQKLVDTGGRVDRFKKRYGMEDAFGSHLQSCRDSYIHSQHKCRSGRAHSDLHFPFWQNILPLRRKNEISARTGVFWPISVSFL